MARQGRPARDLTEEELERQGIQAHATRHWVFLHGTREQFRTHTERMLELEEEYLHRHPQRTWQGSTDAPASESRDERIKDLVTTFSVAVAALLDEEPDRAPQAAPEPPDEAIAALLQVFADAPGGQLHRLEAHQHARRLAPDSYLVAGLYRQDPPLLRAERETRSLTPAGRAWLSRYRRSSRPPPVEA
ncbi:MAG: hypothetical protein JWQ53_1223 [Klenkia sp.]|nr:hypothetical protein [Klenkia sp.]